MPIKSDPMPNVVHSFAFAKSGLPEFTPFEFELTEELSRPYSLRLRVATKDPSVDESKLVGEACTLTLTRGGLVRHINGLVAEATSSGVSTHQFTPSGQLPAGVVSLVIVPGLWVLSQRRNNRIFQNLKVTDILKKVIEAAFADYGRKVTFKTTKTYQELEYCTQYDESDLAFVERLMASEGIMSYFKQGDAAEELILFDDAHSYLELVTLDHGKVSFESTVNDVQTLETVSQFLVDTRLTPTTASVKFFNWSTANPPDDSATKAKDPLGRDRELYLGEGPVNLGGLRDDGIYSRTTAVNQAKLIQETAAARTSLCRGEGCVSGMAPGVTFDLTNALRAGLNRKYLVVRVTHRGAPPSGAEAGAFTANAPEFVYANSFECVPSEVLFRLERQPRRFIQSTQTALVVGNEDITTDVHGRIKVQFHWDREGKDDQNSSCWVRVAQTSSGVGFGAVFIPRQGQEVVVSFLEGDPDKPLVTGSVYNGVNRPPYELPADKTRSVIRTQSTPGGGGYNELSFEDAKDAEEIYLQAERDLRILVKNDKESHVQGHEDLTIDKTRTRKVGLMENVIIGGAQDVAVGGFRNVAVGGFNTLVVGLHQTIMVGLADVLKVGGTQSEEVGKSKTQTVGESSTETVGNNKTVKVSKNFDTSVGENSHEEVKGTLTQKVTKDVTQEYLANQKTTVTKDVTVEIKENQTITVDKKKTETVHASFELTVDKVFDEKCNDKRSSEVANEYKIKTKTLIIEADDEISIKVGSSGIVIKKDGVVIKGAKITVQADGEVAIKGAKVGFN